MALNFTTVMGLIGTIFLISLSTIGAVLFQSMPSSRSHRGIFHGLSIVLFYIQVVRLGRL